MTKVAVLMGSASDASKMSAAAKLLTEFGVEATEHVMSAHRTPDAVAGFAREARERGYGVIICGDGAHTTLPVIGVPLSGSALNGVDALYACVQMPRGVPVASVAIDGAANAALLAVEILAVADTGLAAKLAAYREQWVAG